MLFTESLIVLFSLVTTAGAVPAHVSGAAAPVAAPAETDEAGVGLCKRLGCSDSQRLAFLAIRKLARTQLRLLDHDRDPLRPDLAAAVRQAELTADELVALFAEREADQHRRHEIVAGALAKVHAVLHAKQRKQLASILEVEGLEAVIGERPDRCDGQG